MAIESGPWRLIAQVSVLAAALGTGVVSGLVLLRGEESRSPLSVVDGPRSSLAKFMPDQPLISVDGDSVSLASILRRSPSLLVVLSEDDCLGCGDFGTELRILSREFPGLQQVVIGVGSDTALLRNYFRQTRTKGYLDLNSSLIRGGAVPTPFVSVVDTAGRVLFTDTRPGSDARFFPISQLLPLLDSVIDGSRR